MAPVKSFGEVKRYGTDWWVRTDPATMQKFKRWFPRVNANRQGALVVRATAEVSRDIEFLLTRYPMQMREKDRVLMQLEAEEDKTLERDAEEILAGGSLNRELNFIVKEARPYQLIAGDLALRTGRLLIADDVGLGKTLSSLLILRDTKLLPALIVCQTHLTHQWLEELEKFMPWLVGHIVKKASPYPLAKYNRDGQGPHVLIMNYAKLAGWAPALSGKVKACIFDEAQELRKTGTQKYVAAGMVADQADCVVAATATPIYNYGDEVYNIVEIYAPGVLGTEEEFRREWGKVMGNHLGVKDPAALAAYLKNQNLMIQRTRAEVGRELPKALKFHHSIESDEGAFGSLMEGHRRSAELLSSREASRQELFKLSGEFEWAMRRATGIAKAPFVAEFTKSLLESGEQVVMFGWHHAVYDIWRGALKDYNPAFYTGEESPTQKLFAKSEFIKGNARVLCMSLRAGAGLNGLQGVSHLAVFGELDWSPTLHDQCIGRLRRDGMDAEEPVVAYFMVSENGTDPMMADVLNLKRTQSEPFIDPNAELLTVKEHETGRVKRMAEAFLKN